jgi:hypothetical protein
MVTVWMFFFGMSR